jgi:hypothetical protein
VQLLWHVCGLEVVPTIVMEGMTVVPAAVVMQVLWQDSDWLVQPNKQVCEVALGVGKMPGDDGVAALVLTLL